MSLQIRPCRVLTLLNPAPNFLTNLTGFKAIRKLLSDRRFDK